MQYFISLTTTGISQLITSAKRCVFICLPSMHVELAKAILELNKKMNSTEITVDIQILMDFDAQTFRQGYGDYTAVEEMLKSKLDISNLKDNRISFILVDDIGYYLFVESRSLIPANKPTINAVQIDPVSIVRLKKYFFPNEKNFDYENELVNAIIEESKALTSPDKLISDTVSKATEIDDKTVLAIKTDLENNPPLNPDYKRLVEFYSNKFQYVKLKFKGANLLSSKIEIPAKALPLMDAALKEKLETKLNLFTKSDEQEFFKPLSDFKDKIDDLRKRFLKKVKSRDESLLEKTRKADFELEIDDLNDEISGLQSEIVNDLAAQIEETRERLKTDLCEFFNANPKALFPNHPNLWEGHESYIQKEAKPTSEEIIFHMKWPKAHLLVDGFNLIYQYSDITFEDLKNKEFVQELAESGLIDEADSNKLANFSKGIELSEKKKNEKSPKN